MLKGYTRLLIKYPYPTKIMTSGLIFISSDFIVQKYIEKQKSISFRRLAISFSVGGFYLAPWIHIWFSKGIPFFTQRIVGKKRLKNKAINTISSMLVDQTINSAQCNFIIMTLFGVFNSPTFDLKGAMVASKKALWPVMMTNFKVWPAAQLINFYCMPPHFQLLFVNIVGFFWTIYVNMMSFRE